MAKRRTEHNPLKKYLIISVALNVLFVSLSSLTLLSLRSSDTTIAEYNATQRELCETNYAKYLKQWSDANGEDSKKNFAMLVCLRNYKTGEPLDLEPLSAQIK